jgi:hypothetical protein
MERLTTESAQKIIAAARDDARISGLTHTFYKYPARLSPRFVRVVIETLSEPGDLILDPFVGGGTTPVEARALGRSCIGVDNNELAVFVSRVKTTYLSRPQVARVETIAQDLRKNSSLLQKPPRPQEWIASGYLKNLNSVSVWRLRNLIELMIGRISRIRDRRIQWFLRCAVLNTGQWALDNRRNTPSVEEFRERFIEAVEFMLSGMQELRANEYAAIRLGVPVSPVKTRIIHSAAREIHLHPSLKAGTPPTLVITSPPYPGVHVLYHRWQIHGRRETPAPFWIANCADGHGESRYTFGWRGEKGLTDYFSELQESFRSIVTSVQRGALVVQVVAFSEPEWQLPRYLQVLTDVGLKEISLPAEPEAGERRLWRKIPNRKWYAWRNEQLASNREVILVHRVA